MQASKAATIATFGLFMAEAVIHYNMGVHKADGKKGFVLPPAKDFIKLAAIVGVFSIVNGVIVGKLSK